MATAMLMRPEEEKLFEGQPKVNVELGSLVYTL